MPRPRRQVRAASVIPRAQLAQLVQERVDAAGLSRNDAADVVGDAASQMSLLMRDHLDGFSAERLIRMLTRLGADVDIIVRGGDRLTPRGKVRVISARVRGAKKAASAKKSTSARKSTSAKKGRARRRRA
jgi:predicted XRE-type DNA-binding protein